MCALQIPIVPEFETKEREASYDQWFSAKVEEALHGEKPRLPHNAAMAKVQAMLEERRNGRRSSGRFDAYKQAPTWRWKSEVDGRAWQRC